MRIAIDVDAVWVWGYYRDLEAFEQRVAVRRHTIADGTALQESFPGACTSKPLGAPLANGGFVVMACEQEQIHGAVSGTLLWLDHALEVVASQSQVESPVALAARGSGAAVVEVVGEWLTLRYVERAQQNAGWRIELGQACVACNVEIALQGDEVLAAWHGDNFPPSETTHVLRAYRSGQVIARIDLDTKLERSDSVAWLGVNHASEVFLVDNVLGSASIDVVRVSAVKRPVSTFRSGFE